MAFAEVFSDLLMFLLSLIVCALIRTISLLLFEYRIATCINRCAGSYAFLISLYLISGYPNLSYFQIGTVAYENLLSFYLHVSSFYGYSVIFVLIVALSLADLAICSREAHNCATNATQLVILFYFIALPKFETLEIYIGAVLPFAYFIVYYSTLRNRFDNANYYYESVGSELAVVGISFIMIGALVDTCNYVDIKNSCVFFCECVFWVFILIGNLEIKSLYSNYLIRSQKKTATREDLKIALFYAAVSIGLVLFEGIGPMEETSVNSFYSVLFSYLYSELMAIGVGMHNKQVYETDKNIRISCFLQIITLKYAWTFLITTN